jgi:hypothetical protein
MEEPTNGDATQPTSEPEPTFAHEDELRQEHDHECLGGCDLEHCQRMRG